jgi:hypothetical protein
MTVITGLLQSLSYASRSTEFGIGTNMLKLLIFLALKT